MCGILGYIGKSKINNEKFHKIKKIMKNRGPNNFGFTKKTIKKLNINLFHSRLSIIDISAKANQPFLKKNCEIIFNGEIYNHLELKQRLIQMGYEFSTNSDTEVLLTLYIHYGKECVKYLRGMWAFCIWDKKKNFFFLSRDIFGEKPLYYSNQKDGFYFGSETRYIEILSKRRFKVNKNLIKKNLTYGFKSIYKTNETYFEKLYSLNPGENIILNYNLKINFKKYWNVTNFLNNKKNYSNKSIFNNVNKLMLNSVKQKKIADVPIAIALSGGIDSSAISGILKKKLNTDIEAFSLIDKGIFNERDLIEKTVKFNNIKCNYVNIKYNNFLNKLKKIIKYHNQPISTITYMAQNQLMQEVAKKKFKIILSGTGADEIFSGYYDHYRQFISTLKKKEQKKNLFFWKINYLPKIRNLKLKDPLKYLQTKINLDFVNDYDKNILKYLKFDTKFKFKEKKFVPELMRNRMLNELFFETVPTTLRHEDLNCMEFSVENRSPFLDLDLFKFMNSVPSKKLIQKGYLKFILRETFKKIINKNIRENRSKIGFNASLNLFLKKEKKENLKKFFLQDKVMKKFVDMKKIYLLVLKENRGSQIDKFLFNVINIKIFLENHKMKRL